MGNIIAFLCEVLFGLVIVGLLISVLMLIVALLVLFYYLMKTF